MHDMFVDLFRHMEWADTAVWAAVLGHPAAAGDPKIREALLHIHGTQRAFLCVWTGAPVEVPDPASFPDLRAIEAWGRANYEAIQSFVAADHDLGQKVVLPWSARIAELFGKVHDTTLRETMIQVTSHSTYHRGQINARLRELGGKPPMTDYIAWLWVGRPAASWPAA